MTMANDAKGKESASEPFSFSVQEISTVVALLKENEVTEFRLEHGGAKLVIKREGSLCTCEHDEELFSQAEPVPQSLNMRPAAVASNPAQTQQTVKSETTNYHEVVSPMVGTFYRRPAVDAAAFVEVGDTVKKGDVLCIIEAMKIMNEIEAEVSGKIVEICLDDGQMAEYGEPLFRIDAGNK